MAEVPFGAGCDRVAHANIDAAANSTGYEAGGDGDEEIALCEACAV